MQKDLFVESTKSKKKNDNIKMIGAGLSLVFYKNNKTKFTFKNQGVIIK